MVSARRGACQRAGRALTLAGRCATFNHPVNCPALIPHPFPPMPLRSSDLPAEVLDVLHRGAVIPAHPLALDASRRLDARRQRSLARYYLDAGAGGLAVGVHATQFAIREAGLYAPVLELAAQTAREWAGRPVVLIAGLSGRTAQAKREAETAIALGYHAGMLSLAPMKGASLDELVAHCAEVASVIPLVGFYLQPAVGGIALPAEFWRRFAEIENVVAIKVAPFNRYRTLDVVRGLVAARAEDRVTLYTGNDDHIVLDLAVPFAVRRGDDEVRVRIRGGLLGHWSVWTNKAVELHARIRAAVAAGKVDDDLLALDARVTDCNSAFFDVAHDFAGCIPGCHEVLRRQGLLEGTWCLDPAETLSPGQAAEIDRVYREHGDLADDDFVRANLERWLA
jgi:dihydrodipicolinate synthase/N-acetylneuraminate lyase